MIYMSGLRGFRDVRRPHPYLQMLTAQRERLLEAYARAHRKVPPTGRPPAKGNHRWFLFWYDRLDEDLRTYSGDPDAAEKVRAMDWTERLEYAESIGLIVDDGTGIHPVM